MALDLTDIQGLIHHNYGYPLTRHLLFEITDPASGMHLLKFLAPQTEHAAPQPRNPQPATLLNVGITYAGLAALGVKPQILENFPPEFIAAPDPNSLGDFGDSVPGNWWNGRFNTQQVHLIVHLYGQSSVPLEQLTAAVRAAAGANRELFGTRSGKAIEGAWLNGVPGELHFGYHDGLSQPKVRWDDYPLAPGELDYRHFLLGYDTVAIPSSPHAVADKPDTIRAAELARNGTYSVFRWLHQDVARFNRFLAEQGPLAFPGLSPTDAEELLAAKLMGRWRDGTPLILSPNAPNPALATRNDFGYAADPRGLRCPLSAHIRLTHPRDQPLDATALMGAQMPRVIRRGSPYGPTLTGTVNDDEERGLVGMFFCASILRQFYKLTLWMKESNFSPAFPDLHAQDPLANRKTPDASHEFVIPTPTGDRSVTLVDFVTTKGTAFFLLPSLRTLQDLADGKFQ